MRQYMETFPKEFLAAFGMTGVLSDPGVFYTTYIASWLWPIMAAAAALITGTRAVAPTWTAASWTCRSRPGSRASGTSRRRSARRPL